MIMPHSKKSEYEHHRKRDPGEFKKGTFRTVPVSHVPHRKRYPKGTKAVVGRSKKDNKFKTQSILIPKKKK